ncbi:MAG: YlzJ-like family protein [Eubacteriales bacterium]
MILYTIFDVKKIMEKREAKEKTRYYLSRGGVCLVVDKRNDKYYLNRIISTNPNDYLNPEMQPGKVIF